MRNQNPGTVQVKSGRITSPLLVLAVIVGLSTVVGVGWMVDHFIQAGRAAAPANIFMVLALLMGGLSVVAILVGLAVGIHYAHRLTVSVRRIEYREETEPSSNDTVMGMVSPSVATHSQALQTEPRSAVLDEMLKLLREVAENSLLTDDQKRLKLERILTSERRHFNARIDQFLTAGEYHRARELWQEMADRLGQDDEIRGVGERIEQTRSAAEAGDLAEAKRKVQDLMSISAWDRAKEVAEEVAAKHPESPKTRDLRALVDREHELFEQQQLRRIYGDLQKFVGRRQWKEALAAAHSLLEHYGQSKEADLVRSQIETLEANAEIQERQTLENDIKELIRKHRFSEAAEIARHVIETYPDSPQAEMLRSQLSRLEEKATVGPPKGQA